MGHRRLMFAVAWMLAAVPALAGDLATSTPPPPCPAGQPLHVRVHQGPWSVVFEACKECTGILDANWLSGDTIRVALAVRSVCPEIVTCTLDSTVVPILSARIPPPKYYIKYQALVSYPDGSQCFAAQLDSIVTSPAPPPPFPLPFIDAVAVGPPPPDSVCAGQPITVALSGHFPDACHVLKDVQLIDVYASPYPKPPMVRVIVGTDACPSHACATVITPWERTVILPGLPAGIYRLPIQVQVDSADCAGTVTDSAFFLSGVPLGVGACNAGHCLIAAWDHSQRDGGICDDTVSAARPANVTLGISTPVPLAGLQGRIRLAPAGLHVSNLTPVGPAAGMHLLWAADPAGARFLLYADSGAPIPANPAPDPPAPVIRVTAEVTPGAGTPPVTFVQETDLLGSDETGAGVPECPLLMVAPSGDLRLDMPAANICFVAPCDLNGDGLADIRDLVLMIHCILQMGTCPANATGHLDCDGDGKADVSDVVCCARSMLGSAIAPHAPARPQPGVGVSFGVPSRSEIGLDLPVHVRGADWLGAARIALEFPADRYELKWIDGPSNAGSWLRVEDVQGGRVEIAMIAALPDPTVGSLDLVVHLALRPGQAPGGALHLAGGEFAGPDGTALDVTLNQPDYRLDGPTGLALSPARPNPFAGSTRVTVSVTRPTEIEATVHDLTGRLITIVYHGTVGPGSYPFDWNGRRADGSAAPNGLYFFRVRAGGELQARKVIFLPHN